MKKRSAQNRIAMTMRGIGYVFGILSWAWLTLIVLPTIIESGLFDEFIHPQAQQQTSVEASWIPAPILTIVAGIVTIVILVITVVAVLRMPKAIVESGDLATTRTTRVILPIVTHHKQIPKKRKSIISKRLELCLQVMFSTLPLLITLCVPQLDELEKGIIDITAMMLSGLAVGFFILSFFIAPKRSI